MQSREVHLVRRPSGMPTRENFDLVTVEVPDPADGEVQVRNLMMAVNPAMRGRMYEGRSYIAPFALGETMAGPAIGEVMASNDRRFVVGDHVSSNLAWRQVFNAPAEALSKVDLGEMPLGTFMSLAGTSGKTAYLGMTVIAGLRPKDVVFVSAAAGSVGSIAAQIAKIKGHAVIGSAGGAEKIAFLKEELRLDEAIDYRGPKKLTKALADAAPNGIGTYFDNVGGEHLQAAIAVANPFARFAICGMISQYNDAGVETGPRNLTMIMGKCIRMEGFLLTRYEDQIPDFEKDIAAWYKAGKLKSRETVFEGVERSVDAFLGLLSGENIGKMLVRLDG